MNPTPRVQIATKSSLGRPTPTNQRALKLAKERKFDDLLKHLRAVIGHMGLYPPLIDECVKGGLPALEVIEFLIEHQGNRDAVFHKAASSGQVDLLEACCERKLHAKSDPHFDLARAAYKSTYLHILDSAMNHGRCDVLRWLTIARSKHFDDITLIYDIL